MSGFEQNEVPEGMGCECCGRTDRRFILTRRDEAGRIAAAYCDLCVHPEFQKDAQGRNVLVMTIEPHTEN